jgi:HEPN domain-containing protein
MDKYFRAKRNDLIKRSFRDIADHDYIAARACARLELLDQFLWSSLQCLEKYLKAIILFHDGDTRKIGHNLTEATNRINALQCNPFEVEPATMKFFEYLTQYGGDRYLMRPRGTLGDELLKLDDAVWSVRRFCEDMTVLKESNSKQYDGYVKYLTSPKCTQSALKFRLYYKDGYLEKVLDTDKHLAQREALVWKNLRYGSRKKSRPRQIKQTMTGVTPTHYLFPELFEWMKDHVELGSAKKIIEEQIKAGQHKNCGTIKIKPKKQGSANEF